MAIDYNGEGTGIFIVNNRVYMLLTSTLTASAEEFGIGQSVVSLPLNPGGTTSITFQADRVALELDETFVLELTLLAIGVANGQRGDFESSLQNVFFRSRQEFIIQDSTGITKIYKYANYAILVPFSPRFSVERERESCR